MLDKRVYMPEVRIDSVWHSWWIGLESQRTYKRPHNGREQDGSLLSRNQASVVRREATAIAETTANNLVREVPCHPFHWGIKINNGVP